MPSTSKRNFVVIPNLSSHTNGLQNVQARYLSYKKLCTWAYTSFDIHSTVNLDERVRLLNEKSSYTVAEIVEPAYVPVRMPHAV